MLVVVVSLLLACAVVSEGEEKTKPVWLSSLDLPCVQQSWGRPREGGTVVFEVRLDGKRVYRSEAVLTSGPPQLVRVPLGSARQLALVVTDADDGIACDHADWSLARLTP